MIEPNWTKLISDYRKKIVKHARAYYILDSPTIPDYEYDIMRKNLNRMEKEHPTESELAWGGDYFHGKESSESIFDCPYIRKKGDKTLGA